MTPPFEYDKADDLRFPEDDGKPGLMRIRGMTPEFAAMLERVGAGSLDRLRDGRADRLSDAMLAVHAERRLAGIVPSAAVIEGWIRQAGELEPNGGDRDS